MWVERSVLVGEKNRWSVAKEADASRPASDGSSELRDGLACLEDDRRRVRHRVEDNCSGAW